MWRRRDSIRESPARSDREPGISFDHALLQARSLARAPHLGEMGDAIPERSAILASAALDRTWDADELGAYVLCGKTNGRVAMAAQVDEREVGRKVRVRQRSGLRQIAMTRVIEARTDAVPQQHVDRRLRPAGAG